MAAALVETWLQLWTRQQVNVRAVELRCARSPSAAALTGCGLLSHHNYHIRHATRAETGAAHRALLTAAIFSFGLYLREEGEEGETGGSPGAYLSLKSHLRAL